MNDYLESNRTKKSKSTSFIISATIIITLGLIVAGYFAFSFVRGYLQDVEDEAMVIGALNIVQIQNEEMIWYYFDQNQSVQSAPISQVCSQLEALKGGQN